MFEKIKKQRRVLFVFAGTYLLFGAAFVYLLFMTPGLEFTQQESGGKVQVFLLNNSIHVVRDIEVETAEGEKIISVERLMPQQKALLPLKERTGTVNLVAKAPYHATATTSLSFSGTGETEVKLEYKITIPTTVFVDFNFTAEIEVCNKGDVVPEVKIEERHSAVYFKEDKGIATISLDAGACKKAYFTLTPAKAGDTKIYFNVKALSYSKQLETEITVKE